MTIPPSDTKFVAIRKILNYMSSFRNSGIPIKKTHVEHVSLDRGDAPAGIDSAQWDANPYANFDYRKTWWQSLKEGLGFRTNFDKYRESMAVNAREYDAQLAEKAHNEEYDSASAQAARMRAAGINPDLTGNVDAGSSSGMEPDPNAPMSPDDDPPIKDLATLSTFTDMIMGGFTSAIGLAQNITGLIGSAEDIASKRNANRESVIGSAIDWAMRHVPDVYPEKADQFFRSGLLPDYAENYALESGFRKRDVRLFERTVRDWLASAPGSADAYKAWYERGKSRTDWAQMYGSSLFSESDDTLRDIIDPIIKANDRIRKLKPQAEGDVLAAQSSESHYTEDLYDNLDPSLSAAVQNKTNERNVHSANIDSILNECMDEIISNLRDKSESGKKGHGLATAALLIFSVMRMTNFNLGSTPKGTSVGVSF